MAFPSSSLSLESLVCLFSHDWLVDPIALRCGHILSRAPVLRWLESCAEEGEPPTCPLCREDLTGENLTQAKTLVAVADLATQAREKDIPLPADMEGPPVAASADAASVASSSSGDKKPWMPKWNATITKLTNRNSEWNPTQLGRLSIKNTNKVYSYQTAVIAVADCSGSMQGRPIEQVQSSLRTLLERTYNTKHLALSMVAYSTSARSTSVDTSHSMAQYTTWINDLTRNMASTSFKAAFEEIVAVCERLKENAHISKLEILFLTDGQDDEQNAQKRSALVLELKAKMALTWPDRPYRVHSIGFGNSHDAMLLQALTDIGTGGEGAYRYANPDLNIDALSAKIASILDVVTEASPIPMQLVSIPGVADLPEIVVHSESGDYWIALPSAEDLHRSDDAMPLGLSVDGAAPELLIARIEELDDDSALWQQWWGLQVDTAFQELALLNGSAPRSTNGPASASASASSAAVSSGGVTATDVSLDRSLHFLLLRERASVLLALLPADSPHAARLEVLLEWLPRAQAGEVLDRMTLNDLKCEGKFKTTNAPGSDPNWVPTGRGAYKAMASVLPPKSLLMMKPRDWQEYHMAEKYHRTCQACFVRVEIPTDGLDPALMYTVVVECWSGDQKVSALTEEQAWGMRLNDGAGDQACKPLRSSSTGKSAAVVSKSTSAVSASSSPTGALPPTIVTMSYRPKQSLVSLSVNVGVADCDRVRVLLMSPLDVGPVAVALEHAIMPSDQGKLGEFVFGLVAHRPAEDVMAWVRAHPALWTQVRDANGSNLIQVCANLKRRKLLQQLLAAHAECTAASSSSASPSGVFNLHSTNKHGDTALDLAILGGCWWSYDMLRAASGGMDAPCPLQPTINGQTLLRTVLSRAYTAHQKVTEELAGESKWLRVAARLCRDRIAHIDDQIIENVPTYNVLAVNWLTKHGQREMDLLKAVEMGLVDEVQEQVQRKLVAAAASSSSVTAGPLGSMKMVSFRSIFSIFCTASADHCAIVDYLLANACADPNETIDIRVHILVVNQIDTSATEPEISWPLFAAAEKGKTEMVHILLKHLLTHPGAANGDQAKYKQLINRQNLKLTTCLWVAACNGHIDVVLALLEAGADPNLLNHAGTSALIPCCKKGLESIAELLLEYGLDVTKYNLERDHPVLQCCRDGQAGVLDLLCRHIAAQQPSGLPLVYWLGKHNPIDGYVPLIAAAELNHHECCRVCVKFGADVETRTSLDNEIIGGATALHVACLNGHLRTIQVLIELGADVTSRTSQLGRTIMHLAVIKRAPIILRWMHSALSQEVIATLNCKDLDGRVPAYYASLEGNEAIREEFFTDRLSEALQKVITTDLDTAARCAQVMLKYGRTIGCFEYNKIHSRTVDLVHNVPVMSQALLAGNAPLLQAMRLMGADVWQADERGLPTLFWLKLMGAESASEKALSVHSDLKLMLDRVARVAGSSAHNRLLLNLARGPPALPPKASSTKVRPANLAQLPAAAPIDTHLVVKVDRRALDDLRLATTTGASKEISLLGWLEKASKLVGTKEPGMFPDGREALEQLLWKARVHTVGMIAVVSQADCASKIPVSESKDSDAYAVKELSMSGASPAESPVSSSSSSSTSAIGTGTRFMLPSLLDPIHYLTLYLFTAHPFFLSQVNHALTHWPQSQVWHAFVCALHQGADRLPAYEGESFRGMLGAVFSEETYKLGSVLTLDTFGLGSLHWNTCTENLKQKKGIVFLMRTHGAGKCCVISPFTANPAEGQVLTLPGAKFEVTSYYVADPIALAQANIRGKTYRLTPEHMAKVMASKTSVIVELTEVAY